MKHLSLVVLLHSVILLPFVVTAAILISFGQYGAAALFSFLPGTIVVGIWWIASWPRFATEARSRRESHPPEIVIDE